jgi:hypothetical protein
MNTHSLVSLTLALALVAACAAPTDATEPAELGVSEDPLSRTPPIVLANGVTKERRDGPATLRVVAPAGNVTATVTFSALATCRARVNAAMSTATRTVIDLRQSYDVDDGWNGCRYVLTGRGYRATIDVALWVDD